MARRASSGINPGILLIGIGVFVVAGFFGGKLFLGGQSDSISGAKISMEDVLDGVSLRDNEYVVEGTVKLRNGLTVDPGAPPPSEPVPPPAAPTPAPAPAAT